MKKVFLAAVLAIVAFAAQAQHKDYHSTFQLTFFPPMGTNGANGAQYTNEASLNLLLGVSKNEEAVALAGLANVVLDNANGYQAAGLFNYVGGEGRGVQNAGLFNYNKDHFTGLQLAGIFNLADNVRGVQTAGLVNVANDVHGVQVAGIVNVARRVQGVQFAGIVNIAESSDYPIGLVNIIKDGEMGIALGYNEIGTTSLTFRSGGRVTYGILGLGYNHKADGKKAGSVIGGLGAHINIARWLRLNNEFTMESLGIFTSNEGDTFKAGYALLPAFRPCHNIEIFGGPSINYMQSCDEDMFSVFPENSLWDETRTTNDGGLKLRQLFVGWQVGVQFIF